MTSEERKKPGVHYAVTKDGIELPIVDVSHPAFATNVTALEQKALVEKFLKAGTPFRSFPRPLRNLLMRFFLRGSLLAKGIRGAQGTFLSGMHTYLLKIGPEMLTRAYAGPIDRQIAASLPVLSVRLRLQDVAELMTDTLMTALQGDRRRPLTFVNIAGGPAIDSLNTLILLNKRQPGVNDERRISIEVLDLDDAGPAFGQSALASLSALDGPLHELSVSFRHSRYDWANAANLKSVLREAHDQGALVICSSEGGLFEYGSDSEIVSNLAVLRQCEEVLAVIGSVTRADELSRRLRESSSAATRPRGLEVFRSLVKKAGWNVVRAIERPLSDQVVLRPDPAIPTLSS